MKCILQIILFSLIFYSCAGPKYFTKKQSELVEMELSNSIINYIPILDADLNNSSLLNNTYQLIVKEEYLKAQRYINSIEKSVNLNSEFYLAKSLTLISNKKYKDALQSLNMINDSDYKLLRRLLTIDMTYEIDLMNHASDFNILLKKYQDLIDAYPGDQILKRIVSIRLRYLRYRN